MGTDRAVIGWVDDDEGAAGGDDLTSSGEDVIPASSPERPPMPVAFVFGSRSGSETPHVVTDLGLDPPELACTCPAMRSLAVRPAGCWAMVRVRQLLGWPQP